ncbi:di-trans,poly-cis-decaprenylcistransferase [Candidatus Woesearchaeota archaeon]|nr:di-trans,poly-cis-decaprenylcistransferase [Candidatus Woesearchaeota archaeon]
MSNDLRHIGIILDGNRRYAKLNGKIGLWGHQRGAVALENIIKYAHKKGLNEISFYAFSLKNFNREKDEVDYLKELLYKKSSEWLEKSVKDAKIVFAGRTALFGEKIGVMLRRIEEKTKNNTGMKINFCIAYDGRAEIIDAVKKIREENSEVNEENITQKLYVKSALDLLIRPGGEKRISGFLLWQSSYAELYFTDKYWPEFDSQELDKAISWYHDRNRRFGK